MSDIRHIHGTTNVVANAVSKLSMNALHMSDIAPIVAFRVMAAAQADAPGITALRADSFSMST